MASVLNRELMEGKEKLQNDGMCGHEACPFL